MKRILLLPMALAGIHGALHAQAAVAPESLSAWPYYKELYRSRPPAGLLDFLLDLETLDHARLNQEDARLYDSAGHEIPYVLRVLRDVATSNPLPAREFNRGTEGSASQVSLDLGQQPVEHNRVEIDTAGNNFRRRVSVEGSADGVQWSMLSAGAIIFRFAGAGHSVNRNGVEYPVSRYRYLRIRVSRDSETDAAPPDLQELRVERAIHLQGEMLTAPGTLELRDADRVAGRPASIWRIDLGGRIPIERVLVTVAGGIFSRPFDLDAIDDPSSPVSLASGELTRRDNSSAPLAIDFPERFARRLKLTVTDDRNAPLTIFAVNAQGAARQVIFDSASTAPGTIRLYYGNPRALAPRYDLAARLSAQSAPVAARLALGPQRANPIYRPEPKPFSERAPWLVYVVLAIAGIALAAILVNLARTSAPQH